MLTIARCVPGTISGDVVQVLLYLWLSSFNRQRSTQYAVRDFLPELMDLAEGCHARNAIPNDLANVLAYAFRRCGESPAYQTARVRLQGWFASVSKKSAEHDRADAGLTERISLSAQFGVQATNKTQARLRHFGLKIAARAQLKPSAEDLSAICLSLAIRKEFDLDLVLKWAMHSEFDWWPDLLTVWQHHGKSALAEQLREVLRTLWPTAAAVHALGRKLKQKMTFQYPQVSFASLRNAAAKASPEQLAELRKRCTPSLNNDHLRRDKYPLAALLIPDVYLEAIARDVELILQEQVAGHFHWPSGLRLHAPTLNTQQRRLLGESLPRQLKIRDKVQAAFVSFCSWWGEPAKPRLIAAMAHQKLVDLDRRILEALGLDDALFEFVISSLSKPNVLVARTLFLLIHANRIGNPKHAQLIYGRWLARVDSNKLDQSAMFWAMKLALQLGLAKAVLHWIPENWHYQAANELDSYITLEFTRSGVLACSGALAADELIARCHPFQLAYAEAKVRSKKDKGKLAQATYDWVSTAAADRHGMANIQARHLKLAALIDPNLTAFESRTYHAIEALARLKHPRFLEAASTYLVSQSGSTPFVVNGICAAFLIGFQLPDTPDSRTLWDGLLSNVRNDEALLQLVVAVKRNKRMEWLHSQCALSDTDTVPSQIARCAMIAAMAGFRDRYPQIRQHHKRCAGWLKQALALSLERLRRDRYARAWLKRFRVARTWPEAIGAWGMHLQEVDLRHREPAWKVRLQAYAMPDLQRFERDFHETRLEAIKSDADKLKKTRFGLPLDAG